MRSPEAAPDHPAIPNRAEDIVIVAQDMMHLYDVLGKWERASQRAIAHPTPENQHRFHTLDEIVRNLFALLPELDHPND